MTTRTSRAAANFNQGFNNAYRNRLLKKEQETEEEKRDAAIRAAGIAMPDVEAPTVGATTQGMGIEEPDFAPTSGVPEMATPGFNPNPNVDKLENYSGKAPITEGIPTVVNSSPQDVTTKAVEKQANVPQVTAADWEDTKAKLAKEYAAAGHSDPYKAASARVEEHKQGKFNGYMSMAAAQFRMGDKAGAAEALNAAHQYVGDGMTTDVIVGQEGELIIQKTDEETGEVTEMPLSFDNAGDIVEYARMLSDPQNWMQAQHERLDANRDHKLQQDKLKELIRSNIDGEAADLVIAQLESNSAYKRARMALDGRQLDDLTDWQKNAATLMKDSEAIITIFGTEQAYEALDGEGVADFMASVQALAPYNLRQDPSVVATLVNKMKTGTDWLPLMAKDGNIVIQSPTTGAQMIVPPEFAQRHGVELSASMQ